MSKMLGEAIARDRNKLKISQSMLGRMMRVSQQMVAAWESGTSLPKGPRLRLLLDVLGADGDTFKTVEIIRKIDPTIFEIPDQMLRGSDRAGALSEVSAMVDDGVEHPFLRTVQNRIATQNARRFAAMASVNVGRNLQIEFIRATEQILAATKALAKVSADLAEATRMLAELGPKLEALTPEVNFERPEPEDPSRD